eukprot:SAG31_NODE_5312_length_2615_cov_1.416534_3_plen_141_part_00
MGSAHLAVLLDTNRECQTRNTRSLPLSAHHDRLRLLREIVGFFRQGRTNVTCPVAVEETLEIYSFMASPCLHRCVAWFRGRFITRIPKLWNSPVHRRWLPREAKRTAAYRYRVAALLLRSRHTTITPCNKPAGFRAGCAF